MESFWEMVVVAKVLAEASRADFHNICTWQRYQTVSTAASSMVWLWTLF